jgi:hypothetical protein
VVHEVEGLFIRKGMRWLSMLSTSSFPSVWPHEARHQLRPCAAERGTRDAPAGDQEARDDLGVPPPPATPIIVAGPPTWTDGPAHHAHEAVALKV